MLFDNNLEVVCVEPDPGTYNIKNGGVHTIRQD